jgi:Rad3-related DNA helicase
MDNVNELTPKSELALVRKYDLLLSHSDTIESFITQQSESYKDDYVMISDNFKLEFKPIYGANNFDSMLSNKAERFLFMSGTILNKDELCKNLGISKNDTALLSLDSEFDKSNRPVIFLPGTKMNASWNNPENANNRIKYLNVLDTILNLHKGEKGIINSGNFKIAEYLVDHLNKRLDFKIFHHNPESGNNRNDIIDEFVRYKRPSILISPSITEGLDLKDDKGRFSIIAKVPFGYLGDQWIKRRLELSSDWYAAEAAKDIIQAGGRVVRSSSDHGTTYIIDESFRYFYHKNKSLFPRWWKDAFTEI